MNLFAGQESKHRGREQTCGHRRGRGGWNEIGSFVETWMDLETVIQSAVSQKGKNKYRVLRRIC